MPRVVVPEGTEPPTAMSWLRRRGPPLPEAARQRLFRQETVRLYDPATQRVGRVKKDRLLPPGAMLLLPKAAVAEAAAAAEQANSSSSQRAADAAERRSPAHQQARQAAVAELRASLLRNERDFIAINKPAGLATQGGRKVAVSVDDLMPDAFGGLPGVGRPGDLRLVHRLDRQTTGGFHAAGSKLFEFAVHPHCLSTAVAASHGSPCRRCGHASAALWRAGSVAAFLMLAGCSSHACRRAADCQGP